MKSVFLLLFHFREAAPPPPGDNSLWEAYGEVPLDGVAFSRLEWSYNGVAF